MPTSKKPITVYVSDELYRRVQSRAAAEERSMAQYIARLLERRLPAKPKERPAA